MSFSVYAVRVINGVKHRHFISSTTDFEVAKHVANCCTSGNADYAYVKELGFGTVFFIRRIGYQETDCPVSQAQIDRQADSSSLSGLDRKRQLSIA